MRSSLIALAVAAPAFLFAGSAFAEELRFRAELTGDQQNPPVETSATGSADVVYDTETGLLSWTLQYEGLSSDPSAAHFHGPAAPGENAPPVVPINELASGSEESSEITEEIAAQLMDGLLYINIHTPAHPDGEIRGQVLAVEGDDAAAGGGMAADGAAAEAGTADAEAPAAEGADGTMNDDGASDSDDDAEAGEDQNNTSVSANDQEGDSEDNNENDAADDTEAQNDEGEGDSKDAQ